MSCLLLSTGLFLSRFHPILHTPLSMCLSVVLTFVILSRQASIMRHTGQLEHILCAGARFVCGFTKFEPVSHYMLDILHCMPIWQCTEFRIWIWNWQCHLVCLFLLTGTLLPQFKFGWPQKSLFHGSTVVGPFTWKGLTLDLHVLLTGDA